MKPAQLRKLALALPDSQEKDHHGFPSFRTAGRIFATLPDETHVHLMLTEQDIQRAVREQPTCSEEKWWGKRLLALRVDLESAPPDWLRNLLHDAWERFQD